MILEVYSFDYYENKIHRFMRKQFYCDRNQDGQGKSFYDFLYFYGPKLKFD